MSKLLFESEDWTIDDLQRTWDKIAEIAKDKYDLDWYEPQLEIVSYDQMISVMSTGGFPQVYPHWSWGKKYIEMKKAYRNNELGLALECIINSDPAVAYMMENNSMSAQTLVMAHASVGHSNFFKNNYLFKEWTNARWIFPFMKYAKEYIVECQKKYGHARVELILDYAHRLQDNSVDFCKRKKFSIKDELNLLLSQQRQKEEDYDRLLPKNEENELDTYERLCALDGDESALEELRRRKVFPEQNLLYFCEKFSQSLMRWEKEILRIVRRLSQYFYPQRLTKVMNEGWASFWHYTLVTDLYEQGYVNEHTYLDMLRLHTSVVNQYGISERIFTSSNPYTLGFNIFKDMRRIVENPTEEDKEHLPELCKEKDWVEALKYAAYNFKDESFILQYLSPTIIKKLGLCSFEINNDYSEDTTLLTTTAIQASEDYSALKKAVASQYNLHLHTPRLAIIDFTEVHKKDSIDRPVKVVYYKDKDNVELDTETFMDKIEPALKMFLGATRLELEVEDG